MSFLVSLFESLRTQFTNPTANQAPQMPPIPVPPSPDASPPLSSDRIKSAVDLINQKVVEVSPKVEKLSLLQRVVTKATLTLTAHNTIDIEDAVGRLDKMAGASAEELKQTEVELEEEIAILKKEIAEEDAGQAEPLHLDLYVNFISSTDEFTVLDACKKIERRFRINPDIRDKLIDRSIEETVQKNGATPEQDLRNMWDILIPAMDEWVQLAPFIEKEDLEKIKNHFSNNPDLFNNNEALTDYIDSYLASYEATMESQATYIVRLAQFYYLRVKWEERGGKNVVRHLVENYYNLLQNYMKDCAFFVTRDDGVLYRTHRLEKDQKLGSGSSSVVYQMECIKRVGCTVLDMVGSYALKWDSTWSYGGVVEEIESVKALSKCKHSLQPLFAETDACRTVMTGAYYAYTGNLYDKSIPVAAKKKITLDLLKGGVEIGKRGCFLSDTHPLNMLYKENPFTKATLSSRMPWYQFMKTVVLWCERNRHFPGVKSVGDKVEDLHMRNVFLSDQEDPTPEFMESIIREVATLEAYHQGTVFPEAVLADLGFLVDWDGVIANPTPQVLNHAYENLSVWRATHLPYGEFLQHLGVLEKMIGAKEVSLESVRGLKAAFEKSAIFCLGSCLFYINTDETYYRNMEAKFIKGCPKTQLENATQDLSRPRFSKKQIEVLLKHLDTSLSQLLIKMVAVDPKERPTIAEICETVSKLN